MTVCAASSVYGPAPIGSVPSVDGWASDAGATMSPPISRSVSTSAMSGFGWVQVIWTFVADMAVTVGQLPSHGPPLPPVLKCLIEAATAAASTGVPSENFTPGRSVSWKTLLPDPT